MLVKRQISHYQSEKTKLEDTLQMNPIDINSNDPIAIASVEISIQNLLRNWYRRQKWQQLFLFNPNQHQETITSRSQWRITLSEFLESNPVRLFSITLLLLDLIITSLELSSSLLSCTSSKKNTQESLWYHWGGIAILSLLAAKSAALAVGLGRLFIRRPGYLIDGFVVIGALVLELVLEQKGGGLILVVSLWRVLRIVESAFELSDEAIEAQIGDMICQFEMLKEENLRLVETVAEKDETIQRLYEELNQ